MPYQLLITDKTEQFYADIVDKARTLIKNGSPKAKAVARAVYQKAGENGYLWRSILGGKHAIEDVIKKGPNCIDYGFIVKDILEKYFNIKGTIKETKLVLVKNHQYFITENQEVLDLMVGIPEYPEGYFPNEKLYLNELNKINEQGYKIAFQQIKAILFPRSRKKLC